MFGIWFYDGVMEFRVMGQQGAQDVLFAWDRLLLARF